MLLKIVYGLIILGIIVFIHETGHLIASLLCGVKVEAFSIGMGPVLCHKKIKDIDWRISLLPLGGYCAMKGETDFENEICDEDSFYGVHPFKRGIIAFAGPFFNLLLTFFCFFVIGLVGYRYYSAGNQIQLATDVYPEMYSAAKEAGLLSGDKIIRINSTEILDFSDLYSFVSTHPDEELKVTVERDGEVLDFEVHTLLDTSTGSGKIGVISTPESGKLREAKRYGFFGSIVYGIKETGKMFCATIKGIKVLFKGVEITKAVSGPASITTMLGETVKEGFSAGIRNGISSVLNFVAVISISLFIMNLLPIPVLDGGLILFSIIETVFNVRISPKIRIRVQYIGLLFIAFMFAIAIMGDFNYFMRLFNEK